MSFLHRPLSRVLWFILLPGFLCLPRLCSAKADHEAAWADLDWRERMGPRAAARSSFAPGGNSAPIASEPSAGDYVAQADAADALIAADPSDARVGEARRFEAEMLVRARYLGDESHAARCAALVAKVRADRTLPAARRYDLALLADLRGMEFQTFGSETERLEKLEQVARALVVEFPDAAEPAEGLLSLAKSLPEEQAAGAARYLLGLSQSPNAVKEDARALLSRHALIGDRLSSHLGRGRSGAESQIPADGRRVVLYPWSRGRGGSLIIAAEIAAKAPADATLIGVNLDADEPAARTYAAEHHLPGTQIYVGEESPLADEFGLRVDNTVIITDSRGRIAFVSAGPDLAAKLNSNVR
jgi:hypothetical protein